MPNFDFQGVTYNREEKKLENQEIPLEVDFFDENIRSHHLFLNEAKLSAIAISIYLSSILLLPDPKSGLRILALDDVLIGLDMSNRFPVLDILQEDFKDYQIFLMTYDKAWYEIVKQRTDQKDWKYAEFYFKDKLMNMKSRCTWKTSRTSKKPRNILMGMTTKLVLFTSAPLLKRQSRNIVRERILPVRYRENPKELKSQDFWVPIKMRKKKTDPAFRVSKLVDQD